VSGDGHDRLLAGNDLIGYFALVHAGHRLTRQRPIYAPPGCCWTSVFYGSEQA